MNLFPYQLEGAAWLATKKCAILGDKMGLGKSAQAVLALDNLLAEKILILCPAIARINWDREFRKFSAYARNFQIITTGKTPPNPTSSVICSYDLAVNFEKAGKWKGCEFDAVILDEAHFLKTPKAQRTRVVLGTSGLVRKTKRVWALTGTPMPNHPGELWTLLFTFNVTKLQYLDFCIRYCRYSPGHGPYDPMPQIIGANLEHVDELRAMLSSIMLRRTEVPGLPPIFFQDVLVTAAKFTVPTHDLEKLKGFEDAENPIAILEALAGSVSTLKRIVGMQKIRPVYELVRDELDAQQYEKIVIFAIHIDVIEALELFLQDYNPVVVMGSTTSKARQEAIDRFQNDPKCQVFIGNILAAGTAITLTASDQVLFVEQDWVPGNNAQAAKRLHRIGQKNPVIARFVGIANTLDEKIAGVLRRKSQDIAMILDDPREQMNTPFSVT